MILYDMTGYDMMVMMCYDVKVCYTMVNYMIICCSTLG